MAELPLPDVTRLVAAANAARGWSDDSMLAVAGQSDAERRLEALFGVGRTLAVYGTLAPGQPNHHVVAPLGGEWTAGIVEGDFSAEGWGATLGYPAFRPQAGGAAVAVQVLISPALETAWLALDQFEGPEYRRILVPVFRPAPSDERQLYTVANIYAAGSPGMETSMTTSPAQARLTSFAPQLLVDDLARSIAYYERLGFTFGEPWNGFYAIGARDGLELHLKEAPKSAAERRHRREQEHLDAAAGVDGVEAFYAQCVANGAMILKPLAPTAWGTADFYIEDPDGNVIAFGGRT